ncbi:procollagen-lysine,2-oxoglutarate 5-dioxygenase 1-like isoform X2 [Mytilus edulis]|uniref:procollagen-lysine,2-oxoglutarate 5-dioxygenase 1-like isoform X2 n=1 Tax=Mytilus edulis TaxID=6550 RepID=UPI0039F088BE
MLGIMKTEQILSFYLLFVFGTFTCVICSKFELTAITIAPDETDSLTRYQYTADKNGIKTKVYGLGHAWRKAEEMTCTAGGYKVNVLRDSLGEFTNRQDLVLIYTDSSDTVFIERRKDILSKFKSFDAKVVFAADNFIWPDPKLKQYPKVPQIESRYLNGGAFIGYAKTIVEMLNYKKINDMDDDQLYFTKIFLDKQLREQWNIKIDTKSEIFQSAVDNLEHIIVKYKGNHSYIVNKKTGSKPLILYGNGPIKTLPYQAAFNRLASDLADEWTETFGCAACSRSAISLKELKKDDYPIVQLSVFIDQPIPFLVEGLKTIKDLDYPKKRIDLLVYNNADYHEVDVELFLSGCSDEYRSVTVISTNDEMTGTAARNSAIDQCLLSKCAYLFFVDGNVHITDPKTLKDLIEQNRTILAPMLSQHKNYWSNFWTGLNDHGYYGQTEDYTEMVDLEKKGLWNVPYIRYVYLIHGSIMPKLMRAFTRKDISDEEERDISFTKNIREKGLFMYVNNMKYRGHLVNTDDYNTTHLHSDMFQMFKNPLDWEKKYIHENYSVALKDGAVITQPCPDVYWFPIVSDTFCDHMIETMEDYGKWSDGGHEDIRVGGYENVPTVDIHMRQIDFDEHFLDFLQTYVRPLKDKVYPGMSEEASAVMNFVVRYRPGEQDHLEPHHDASTYTINIGLNRQGIDYAGGGSRFIRYNCSVVNTRKGWMIMHPGKLTHYHEGLYTTSGTRYILVSFLDP